jgi:hypothetical protein
MTTTQYATPDLVLYEWDKDKMLEIDISHDPDRHYFINSFTSI